MAFEILKSKTLNLFKSNLTEKQIRNSNLNIEEARNGVARLESYPRRVVLELTNACNFNCIMCGRNNEKFKPNFLDPSYIDYLAEVLNHAEEVTLFGRGEPTIHPQFKEILKKLKEWPVRKYFVTNGSTLGDIKGVLFDCKVDIMAVSVDGATPATNDRIRRNSDFNYIIKNLKDVVKLRNRTGSKFPYINFVFTMMKSNISELVPLVKLASEIGIEEVKAVYMTSFTKETENEVLWENQSIVKDIFEKSIQLARDYNIKIKLPFLQGEDVAGSEYHKKCYMAWRDFFIGSDSYIRPCQSTSMKLLKFTKKLPFDEMWNSESLQDFRLSVNNALKMPDNCKKCYQSSHANCNRREAFIYSGEDFAPNWKKEEKNK